MRFRTRQPGGVLPQIPHRGSFEHPYVRIRQRCPGLAACGTAAQGAQGENRASVLQRRQDVQAAVSARTGEDAHHLIVALRSIFRALRQERLIFANPCAGISGTRSEALPVTLPPDRLAGLLDRARSTSSPRTPNASRYPAGSNSAGRGRSPPARRGQAGVTASGRKQGLHVPSAAGAFTGSPNRWPARPAACALRLPAKPHARSSAALEAAVISRR
jgi:hypothetical protein